jgi:hypothetical protein
MADKKPYETAVDEFEDADKAYRELEAYVTSGDAIVDIATEHGTNSEAARAEWVEIWTQLREKLDDRNAKYTNAANEMRKVLAKDVSQGDNWRGPEGKADRVKYGPLECNTRTKRFFVGEELIKLAERKGIFKQVEDLTYLDETTNRKEPVVSSVILVAFKPMLQWLRDNNHEDIINGAYEEKEETPMVQGDKKIAFLGQKVDK